MNKQKTGALSALSNLRYKQKQNGRQNGVFSSKNMWKCIHCHVLLLHLEPFSDFFTRYDSIDTYLIILNDILDGRAIYTLFIQGDIIKKCTRNWLFAISTSITSNQCIHTLTTYFVMFISCILIEANWCSLSSQSKCICWDTLLNIHTSVSKVTKALPLLTDLHLLTKS